MHFHQHDRILIHSRMREKRETREARVSRVDGEEVHFEPANNATHLRSGYGSFKISSIGAKPFGIQRVEVIGRDYLKIPPYKLA
jgi:hypothetical protein